MMRKIVAKRFILMGLVLTLLWNPQGMVQATTVTMPQEFPCGLIPVQIEYAIAGDEEKRPAAVCSNASREDYNWDSYSSDYYFTKLSKQEQILYMQMDAACKELLTTTVDATSYTMEDGSVIYATKKIEANGLSTETIQKVRNVFYYSEPQYYFLNPSFVYASGQNAYAALGVYPEFIKGSERQTTTELVKQRLEEYKAAINTTDSQSVTDQSIRDLLCDKLMYYTSYKNSATIPSNDPDYTQSIYGALTAGQTVCAGYTKMYVLLCNACGLECVPAISNTHGWNYVRYGENWFAVDLTWEDANDATGGYFRVSDSELSRDDTSVSEHAVVSDWLGMVPKATQSYTQELGEKSCLDAPEIEVKDTPKGVALTFDAPDANVYYTIGTDVNLSERKATGSVNLTSGGMYVVTAKAVKEGYFDSKYAVSVVRIAEGKASIVDIYNKKTKKIQVRYQTSQPCDGYELCYASTKKFTNAKSQKMKVSSAVIKGLKKNKIYYVRVRGFKTDAYGNYYYTPYSTVKKIKVTQ